MAQNKGGGSTRNGRDSKPKMLGVKAFGGELISAGSIIVRQRGTQFHPATNVGVGKSSFALVLAHLLFDRSPPDISKIARAIDWPKRVPPMFPVLVTGSREGIIAAIARGDVDEGFVNELHELFPSLQIRKPRQAGLRGSRSK